MKKNAFSLISLLAILSLAQTALAEGLIVRLKADNAPAGIIAARNLPEQLGLRPGSMKNISPEIAVLDLPAGISAAERANLEKQLVGRADVAYIQADRLVRPMAGPTPNDPFFANNSQWSLSGPAGINVGPAWERSTGRADQVIAVIDTGILPAHPDLGGKVLPGYDFVSNTDTANDGGGWDSDPTDPGDAVAAEEPNSWHGTFVSGIIAASSDNSIGMAGVNWMARILPVRALGKGGGSLSELLIAMRWAAGLHVEGAPDNPNPARILNLSLGADGGCGQAEQEVLSELQQKGAVVITAAGNAASRLQDAPVTPAVCPGVITVAATDRQGQLAPYSNYGSSVSISAPGGYMAGSRDVANGILSLTLNTDETYGYAYNAGTSFSTALVSGVASLMLAVNPQLTAVDLNRILRDSAVPIQVSEASSPCATPGNCGAGRLDAGAALARAQSFTAGSAGQTQYPAPGQGPTTSPASAPSGGGGGCVMATDGSTDSGLILLPVLLWLLGRLSRFRPHAVARRS
ncbi:S8 family peptidase [Thermithiobacillus plumbiphilus]|uniref:S8 family peptidase n=1 Tax=Thermithiobacillus plumbiphilus TaxID=1729899 RepID=A0ABU9D3Z0_9PROT